MRCLGLRLSEAQRQQAQRRKRRKAQADGRTLQTETLYLAGWLLLVTTLPAPQWSARQVLALYRARWHIELLFKRIKQLLHQHRLRCESVATARATLCALLLAWALQEEELVQARLSLQEAVRQAQAPEPAEGAPAPEEAGEPALSEWLLATLSVDLLRQQVRGYCALQRYRACLPRLQRFVRGSPRRRRHWYSDFCRWLGSAELSSSCVEG